jgi:hypothetical protein
VRKLKKKRLQAKGWKIGSAAEFLGLSAEEAAYLDLKLKLASDLRERRLALRLTQGELARLVRSSQSRVAKMEAGDATVSLDLLVRALIALGASRQRITRMLTPTRRARAA